MDTAIQLSDRLQYSEYDAAECTAAIRGAKIPLNLGLKVARLCTIRGIRYHPNFATELYSLSEHLEFTRALNARCIMSDDVPDMQNSENFPYCIWHPEVASEDTYRELVGRYPQMRYHVGRACAVAGYNELYHELNLLPDVSIAEEARENKESGQQIFESIMSQPQRYAVMNDYTCSVNLDTPHGGAFLNGDTAVRSLLDIKQTHVGEDAWDKDTHDESGYFNITEDWCIDEFESDTLRHEDTAIQLLYTPLPLDLPTVHKDLLILMAAYNGDIDRYSRLRRPVMLLSGHACIGRGIYNNTMFAKWVSLQHSLMDGQGGDIRRSLNARFIMDNDLSRITGDTPDEDLPYQIWYPQCAHFSTFEELARRRPAMRTQAARACIVADYKESYVRIGATPDCFLIKEAEASTNPCYLEDLRRRVEEEGVRIQTECELDDWENRSKGIITRDSGRLWNTSMHVPDGLSVENVSTLR